MKITRKVSDIGKGYGGIVEIELTPREIWEAYEIQRKEFAAEDIAQEVIAKLEDNGKEESVAMDWPMRVGQHYASDFVSRLDGYDYYNELYNGFLREMVDEFLKELGYDPDTMEKEGKR